MIKKLIPDGYYNSIYDIDYKALYASGIRLILTDLDNTLISYKETEPNEKLMEFKNNLEAMGFELIIVSNSKKDRVNHFASMLNVKFVKLSLKPLKRGINKAIKKVASKKYEKNEILLMGDQLMTDVFGGNRAKLKVFLIKAVDKSSDTLPTRINRKFELHFLKKIQKKYPDIFKKDLSRYMEDTYGNKKM